MIYFTKKNVSYVELWIRTVFNVSGSDLTRQKKITDLDLNLMIFIIRKLGRIRCRDEKIILMKHY